MSYFCNMENQAPDNKQFNYLNLGSLIRKYRKEKDLKLLELSSITGITSSMLSKIENGRMIPTIPTLFTIIHKLGVSLDVFFAEFMSENKFEGYIYLPKSEFSPYEKEEEATGFQYFSILENSFDGGAFQISLLELASGCKRALVTTAAFEFIYLINGNIQYQLEERLIDMKEGDALFFDGNIPHVPVNPNKKQATLLVIYFFGSTTNTN